MGKTLETMRQDCAGREHPREGGRPRLRAAVALLIAAVALGPLPESIAAPGGGTYIVKLATDLPDGDLTDGVCSTVEHTPQNPNPPNPETCTLRAAIQTADRDADRDTVAFELAGAPATIALTSYLPSLHHPIAIDGWLGNVTSPSGSTIPQPPVRIDGSGLVRVSCNNELTQTGPNSQDEGRGFVVFGAQSLIQGLNLSGFPCDDIVVWGADGTTISGNYIGTNAAGDKIDNYDVSENKDGVYVDHSTGVTIGGPTPARGNVVTTPKEFAIYVVGGSHDAVVRHNKVGVSPAGDVPLGATPGVAPRAGIVLVGRRPGQALPISNPVVADNQIAGMNDLADHPAAIVVGTGIVGATVERNLVGINASGNQMVLGGIPYSQALVDGIVVRAVDPNQETRDTLLKDNVVAAMRIGIMLQGIGVHHTRVEGNAIGVAKDRTTAIPNEGMGVLVTEESHDNVIGYAKADTPLAACTGTPCNVIANNGYSGVALETPPPSQNPPGSAKPALAPNTVRGNSIYLNKLGGIDRAGYGITPNNLDPANPDVDFPEGVSRSVMPGTQTTVVSGVVRVPDPANADLTIDVYRLDPPDQATGPNDRGVIRPGTLQPDGTLTWPPLPTGANPSSFGEGRVWVGTVARGDISFDGRWRLRVPGTVDPAAAFTATVTDARGDTSEFSAFCADTDGNGTADNDGDALCDDWEQFGIDTDGDGTNDLPLPLAPYNAHRDHRDVFVEVDWIDNGKPHDMPKFGTARGATGLHPKGLSAVVAAFADAPESLPANAGIDLHLSPGSPNPVDEATPAASATSFRGPASDCQKIKRGTAGDPCDGSFGTLTERMSTNCAAILGAKALVFRYALFGERISDVAGGGASDLGGSDFLVGVGKFSDIDAENAGAKSAYCITLDDCWGRCRPARSCTSSGTAWGSGTESSTTRYTSPIISAS